MRPYEAHKLTLHPGGQDFTFESVLDYGYSAYTFLNVQLQQLYPTPKVVMGSVGRIIVKSRSALFTVQA